MATTTTTLSGVTINEIHLSPSGPSQDLNGDGFGDLNDEFVELINTSGSTVDISGWQIWINGATGHTFAGGTTLAPGARITVVDSNGGGTIQNVPGDAVFSSGSLGLDDSDSFALWSATTNEYTLLRGEQMDTGASPTEEETNVSIINMAHPGATQSGPTETLAADVDGSSHKRTVDGDETWTTGTPDPGSPNCFAEGTLIRTPDGEIAVEDLKPGDRISTADGRTVPVLWVGHQTIMKQFWGERAALVRISAGALGDGPHSDLTVTADHGMVLDDCVINAAALVNDGTVEWIPTSDLPERYTVYHVETPGHEVIFANGAASESYLDIPGRRSFDNYNEYVALVGEERPIREARLPRIGSARMLPLSVQLRMLM